MADVLQVVDEREAEPQFAPGTFGCHEALHMAAFLEKAVEDELCEHPAIEANPEWLALAEKAAEALIDLYQAIGAAHLSKGGAA